MVARVQRAWLRRGSTENPSRALLVPVSVSAPPPTPPVSAGVRRIERLVLNVGDLGRAIDFYARGLGFAIVGRTAQGARLAIGAQQIELLHQPEGRPYPERRAANDPWFQHFAIAVGDMAAAYARLSNHGAEPITHGGPQLLPPSTGSVTAYKFRDPDGHPLELSHAPASHWSRAAPSPEGGVFLGIDHTALAVGDLEASIAFYTDLGFRVGTRSLNQGSEQARLDGLAGATVDIVTLLTPEAGPHIELLHYRAPTPPSAIRLEAGDIAATTTVLVRSETENGGWAARLMDPDGHLLRFIPS